jgi:hypothetical protein
VIGQTAHPHIFTVHQLNILNKYAKVLPLKDMRKLFYLVTKCDSKGKVESGDCKIEKNHIEKLQKN